MQLPEVKPTVCFARSRQPFATAVPTSYVAHTLPWHVVGGAGAKPDPKDSLMTALGALKRFGRNPPAITKEVQQEITEYGLKIIKQEFPCFPEELVVSFEEWLAQTPYEEYRKQELRECRIQYERTIYSKRDKDFTAIKSFIKDEKYPTEKFPRWINARSDLAKVYAGPIVHSIYKMLEQHPMIIKKVPVAERAQALMQMDFAEAAYYGVDFESLEAHYTPEIMEMRHEWYAALLETHPEKQEFMRFCEAVLAGENNLEMRNWGSVCLEATLMSGEMDTSASNTLLNMIVTRYVAMKKGATYYNGKFEGDDSANVVYPRTAVPTVEDYAECGWTVKIELSPTLLEMSFCGNVADPEDLCNVTDPILVMTDFGWTNRKWANAGSKAHRSLLKAKAISLGYSFGRTPILWKLAQVLLKELSEVKIRESTRNWSNSTWYAEQIAEAQRLGPNIAEPPLNTRFLVQERYGISIADQFMIENSIEQGGLTPYEIPLDFLSESQKRTWEKVETEKFFMEEQLCRPWAEEAWRLTFLNDKNMAAFMDTWLAGIEGVKLGEDLEDAELGGQTSSMLNKKTTENQVSRKSRRDNTSNKGGSKRPKEQLEGIEKNPGPGKGAQVQVRIPLVEQERPSAVLRRRKKAAAKPKRKRNRQQGAKQETLRSRVRNVGFLAGQPQQVLAIDRFYQKNMSKLTQQGQDFLKMCLDPMHDCAVMKVGWPDDLDIPSIVRKISQEMGVAYPVANTNFPGTLGSTWDCYIVLNPWLNTMFYESMTRVNNVIQGQVDPGPETIGGLQAWACQSGTDWGYGYTTGPNPTIPLLNTLSLSNTYTVGAGRLVSIGIEVINTTPLLTKGGTITIWRAPEPLANPTGFQYLDTTTGDTLRSLTATEVRYPPQNPAQALLYEQSSTWGAELGAYMVGTFLTEDNPATMVNYTVPYMTVAGVTEDVTNQAGDATSQNTSSLWLPTPVNSVITTPAVKIYPINQMGCMLTGLSPQSTLTVRMILFYESFPSIAQEQLLNLAGHNTPHDPIALQYLSMVYKLMPPGVPSDQNFDGEWWANVVEWLGAIAGVGASVFGLPEVGLAVNAAASAGALSLRRK